MDPQQTAEAGAARLAAGDAVLVALGITVLEVGPGRASARMVVAPTMVNGVGTTHGGYVFLLADTAFAYACNSRGQVVVASSADVDFLEPTHVGDELVAVARERVLRARSGVYDVTVSSAGRTVAEFRGRSRALGADTSLTPLPHRPPRAQTTRQESTP